MATPHLTVLICSTRPHRVGAAVGAWFASVATAHSLFNVEVVDLADVALPLFDEPQHPALRQYQHDHTRRWSQLIDGTHSLVFVVPEYNHSFNAATKNAIDYLFHEWRDKAVGFVSYGGVSAGSRAVAALRPVLVAVKAVPVTEAVSIPHINTCVNDGVFEAPAGLDDAGFALLDELYRRERVLRDLRADAP